MTPEEIIEYLLGDFGVQFMEKTEPAYYCNCSKERVEKALISIGKKDLQDMIADGEPIEVNCHFCDKKYTFTVEDLKEILKKRA